MSACSTGINALPRRGASGCGSTSSSGRCTSPAASARTGNEGFGEPYSLPNISAYSETCAVLMFITLNHRLFLATGDSQLHRRDGARHVQQRASTACPTAGDRFFYVNRLASAGDGRDARWERASLECCPPNLVRFLASMPGFVYAQDSSRARSTSTLYVSSETFVPRSALRDIRLTVDSENALGRARRGSPCPRATAREPRSSCAIPDGRAISLFRAASIPTSNKIDAAGTAVA